MLIAEDCNTVNLHAKAGVQDNLVAAQLFPGVHARAVSSRYITFNPNIIMRIFEYPCALTPTPLPLGLRARQASNFTAAPTGSPKNKNGDVIP